MAKINIKDITVGKARRLAVPVNIWGNPFDGSADVDGNLKFPQDFMLQILYSEKNGANVYEIGTRMTDANHIMDIADDSSIFINAESASFKTITTNNISAHITNTDELYIKGSKMQVTDNQQIMGGGYKDLQLLGCALSLCRLGLQAERRAA